MTLSALIFDVDGTLAETEEAHRAAFNAAFAALGLDWHWTRADYRTLLKTTGGKERIRAHLNAQNLPPLTDAEIAEIHAKKTSHYVEILGSGQLPLREGVADLITSARAAGLRLAIATTTSRPNIEALAQCCWGRPAAEVFDVIAAGDEVARKKPAPDVFQLALARLGLAPERAIAFEDSLNGLRSAQAAGLRTIVTPSLYTDDENHTAAQWCIPSLAQAHLPTEVTRAIAL